MPGLDFASVKQAKAVLTDAQIKQLCVSPYVMIPAQGANKVAFIIASIFKRASPLGGVYSGAAVNLGVQSGDPVYANGAVMSNLIDLSIALDIINYGTFTIGYVTPGASASLFVNSPISLVSLPNPYGGGWPFSPMTGGNAANTLSVTLYYIIVDV